MSYFALWAKTMSSFINDKNQKKGNINILLVTLFLCQAGAETGLVLLMPGTTNNSVNVIQNGLKIIH